MIVWSMRYNNKFLNEERKELMILGFAIASAVAIGEVDGL